MGNQFIQLPEYQPHGDVALKRDTRSDLASVVGVFYFLLTGRAPGSLSDGEGKAPQDRKRAIDVLDGLPAKHARQVRRIFERGFQHNLSHRWETAGLLRNEVRLVSANGEPVLPSFDEQLESLNRELLEEPEYKAEERFGFLVAALTTQFTDLVSRASAQVRDVLQFARGSGIMIGSALVEGRAIGTFQIWRKHKMPARPVAVSLSLRRRDGEVVLVGSVAGTARELKPCGLFDPEAGKLLLAEMQQFVIDSIKEGLAAIDAQPAEPERVRNQLFR
jgi:hypothetical protein